MTSAPGSAASPSGEPSIVIMPPEGYPEPVTTLWDQRALQEAEDEVRRARNGLIATATAFGVSMIFLGVGFSQCEEAPNGDLVCSNSGDALTVIGGFMFLGGAIGVITTGIMLPIRKRKKLDLQREIQLRRYYGAP